MMLLETGMKEEVRKLRQRGREREIRQEHRNLPSLQITLWID